MADNLFEKSFSIKNNTYSSSQFKPLWGQMGVFTSIPVIGKTPRFIGLNKYLNTFNKTCRYYEFSIKIDLNIIRRLVGRDLKKFNNFNHLLRIATNGTTLSISFRKRIKTKNSVIGFIKKYKRRDFRNKNLFYKKLLKFMSEINYSENEIILIRDGEITEGAVTNLIFIKKDKIYIPKTGYYYGNTLKLIEDVSKSKFFRKKILLKDLKEYSEIISIGSGRGITSIKKIPSIFWQRNSTKYFQKLKKDYEFMIKRNYYEI